MPRKPLTPIPSDERLKTGADEEIRHRLNDFVRQVFKTQRAFEQAADVPHETAAKWFKKGGPLPDFENLRKCAEQGLSVDWLMTGRGEMMQRVGSTEVGAALERMLPYMRREAHVGDYTTKQAFARMVTRFGGADGLIRRAAELFQADFNAAIAETQRGEDYLRLTTVIQMRLNELAENTANDDMRVVFKELCVELDNHLDRTESQRE